MFFIVNKTKKHITLGDIGINLGPRQAIDLDKIMKRAKSDESRSLRTASRRGEIEIRVKDKPRDKKIPNTKSKPKSDELGAMKAEIIGEMRELLKGRGGGISKEDLKELIAAMPKSSETVIYRQEGEKISKEEEVEIDEGTLAIINARTVDNIVKGTEIKAVHYEEKHEENTILDNVGELEDLLG